jgi:hypothetical protein
VNSTLASLTERPGSVGEKNALDNELQKKSLTINQ